MPNEVFDPKKPNLQYYNDKPEDHDYKLHEIRPRMRSIFSSRRFMLIYSLFLLFTVTLISVYQKGGLYNIPIIKHIIPDRALEIKLESIKHADSVVTASIKIENVNYKNNFINTLIADTSLLSGREVIASNSYIYNNIVFPSEQAIGVNIKFRNKDWNNADTVIIKLYLDKTYMTERKIKIQRNEK